jgi:hypothetical protein
MESEQEVLRLNMYTFKYCMYIDGRLIPSKAGFMITILASPGSTCQSPFLKLPTAAPLHYVCFCNIKVFFRFREQKVLQEVGE